MSVPTAEGSTSATAEDAGGTAEPHTSSIELPGARNVARTEARIKTRIWQDDDFRDQPPSAQRLYLCLLSQPELKRIPIQESGSRARKVLAEFLEDFGERPGGRAEQERLRGGPKTCLLSWRRLQGGYMAGRSESGATARGAAPAP